MLVVIGKNNKMQPDFKTLKPVNDSQQPDFASLKPFQPIDTNKVGSIPIISPIIDTMSNIGVGIGSAIGKAGLGLGQTFLKGANVVGNILGTEKNQYDKNIQAIESIKQKLYEEPFKEQLDTISGKTGEFIGATIPFVATQGVTTAGQQFAKGLTSEFVTSLAKQGGLKKVGSYFIKLGTDVLPDVANTYATQYIASGGDKESAKDVGIATAVLSGLTHVGSDVFKTFVPQTAKEALGRALNFTGKTKLGDVVGEKQLNDSVDAFTTLNNLAPEIKVLDDNGIEKIFDPKKATIVEMPQALYQAKNKIYDAYSTLAEKAGDKGAFFGQTDFNKLINTLDKYSGKGYTKAYTNKAQDIVESLYRYGKVNPRDGGIYFPNIKPSEMQVLIENINKDVNPSSDKAGSVVAQEASQTLRNILDNKIEKATGGTYQELRNAYSQLKTIEQPIINMYKKALRESRGTFSQEVVNSIASVDGIMGLLTQNPEALLRAGVLKTVSKLLKYNKDPEVNMQRAFRLLRESAGEKEILPSSLSSRLFNTPENTQAFKAGENVIKDINSIPNKQGGFISTGLTPYKETGNLTTKILKDLEGKTTVSKQYILDATNRGELKQVERDITRDVLDTMKGDTVNVQEFANKVKAELLPLKRKSVAPEAGKEVYNGLIRADQPRYESIALPDDLRGKVKNYSENIYESPIKTSAGDTHFRGTSDNYFGHTRIEDMADNKTRRVIEVQSDLYQKGNLADKVDTVGLADAKKYFNEMEADKKAGLSYSHSDYAKTKAYIDKYAKNPELNPDKLQQYNDPTAHFRMIREEIKKAAQDGKTKLQFPTGETAMKIEGLGQNNRWFENPTGGEVQMGSRLTELKPENLSIGKVIGSETEGDAWIITDVLGDGKFKAVPKRVYDRALPSAFDQTPMVQESLKETFDISGKVDTNNPIYKFYEKDVGKYLSSKYNAKRIVDDKGVSWIEVPITKEQGKAPVEAFGKIGISPLTTVAGTTALGAIGAKIYADNKKK